MNTFYKNQHPDKPRCNAPVYTRILCRTPGGKDYAVRYDYWDYARGKGNRACRRIAAGCYPVGGSRFTHTWLVNAAPEARKMFRHLETNVRRFFNILNP